MFVSGSLEGDLSVVGGFVGHKSAFTERRRRGRESSGSEAGLWLVFGVLVQVER